MKDLFDFKPGWPSMVYGPRNDEELAVVEDLVRASHRFPSD